MKYCIIIYIIFIIPLSAQEVAKPSWEIGTDLRHVFKNQLYETPYIFLRKSFTKVKAGKEQMLAYRFGLQFKTQNHKNFNSLRWHLMLGKEWQYSKNKFKVGYGIDTRLIPHYHNFKDIPNSKYYLIEYHLTPFVGINYEILKGVWLSGESALSVMYRQQYFENKPMEHDVQGSSLAVYRFGFSINI